jgi:serine phosphatase RsbU (regulator of sigma subunit)/pSer/pThr/pTyr-binding forkhead associated (FHA) protein
VDAGVRLDHAMVSRHHAELLRDPFGRWWVRDLGSRNGTVVNGTAVAESPVGEGDRIHVGEFVLLLNAPPTSESPGRAGAGVEQTMSETRTRVHVSDATAGKISTLQEVEPPRVAAAHLTALNDLSQHLLATPDAQARLTALCAWTVGEDVRGRWAAAVRVPRQEPETHSAPPEMLGEVQYAGTSDGKDPYISRSVLRAIRQKAEPILAGNAGLSTDVEVSISPSIMALAAIACPLRGEQGGEDLDLLYVVLPPEYGTGEWLALVSLAVKQWQQAESTWQARRQAEVHAVVERELGRARQIQMRLVPKAAKVEGLDLAIGFSPCKWVGGDYVDVVPAANGRTFLAVADVCGKGLGAALVASSIHTMVHASALAGMGPCELMANLNQYLRSMLPEDSFVTMVCIGIDGRSGEYECVNAGHPPALLLAPGKAAVELQSAANLPLGVASDEMGCEPGVIRPGELLALYTDGLTELSDESGQMLDVAGLSRHLVEICGRAALTAKLAADELNKRLDQIQGKRLPDDDRTFLLARRV